MNTQSISPVQMIVGAYGGLGIALARRLRSRGSQLVLVGRDELRLSLVADQFECPYMIADASNFDDMKCCVESAMDRYGRLDGVISTVGSLLIKPAHLTSEQDWNEIIYNNLNSAFSVLRASVKPMMERGGSIVLVSPVAFKVGRANHDALAAAQSGLDGLIRSASASYFRYGIRINSVSPRSMNSSLIAGFLKNQDVLEAAPEAYPSSNVGSSDELAVIIEWLLSQDSAGVTGQAISVDGGITSVNSLAPASLGSDFLAFMSRTKEA